MKATETKLLDFLKKSEQLQIPIYQRTYSWTQRECGKLWEDILSSGSDDSIPVHFTGSIVYIENDLYQVTNFSPLLIINGQQRLTTVMLILEALARRVGNGEPTSGFSADKLRNYYLLNRLEAGERRFKLLLTETDKQSLLSILRQGDLPSDRSLRVTQNFEFIKQKLNDLNETDLIAFCKGLAKLAVVDVSLVRGQDNPQLVFESMNSTGLDLSQADLIRNFILMGLDQEEQSRLYVDHWRPMELLFGQEAYGKHFDGFMRHYLTLKTGNIPNIKAVYEAFKNHAMTREGDGAGVGELVAEIHKFARYYCALALDKEKDNDLSRVFSNLRELKVDVAYPFLLEQYDDYDGGGIRKEDFIYSVNLIEAYIFRRWVCDIPSNSHNMTFATFGRAVNKDKYRNSIQEHFLRMPTYRRFPSDEEFKRKLICRDLYPSIRCGYLLRRLENHDRKERVPVEEYTIEHIMPQNKNLSEQWRQELGQDWRNVQETWLHTIGNLTLTGYNSEYSDHSFADKREMTGGFRHSPLRLNQGLGDLECWNSDSIQARAEQLAKKAISVWESPGELAGLAEAGFSDPTIHTGYSYEDHPNLANNSLIRGIFNSFRREVLFFDSCVNEEFFKNYIAYKAETNFVDVVPRSDSLKLFLNLEFHELHDPKRSARDVTNIGHLGNGDVEVILHSEQDLAYVMGLVRQAFEKQMDNNVEFI